MNKENVKGILICVLALGVAIYLSVKSAEKRIEEKAKQQNTQKLGY